jgi:hypothetical protein
MHRDPKHFSDPNAFKPERWMDKGSAENKARHPYAFQPFGCGSRMCLGYKMATMELVQVRAGGGGWVGWKESVLLGGCLQLASTGAGCCGPLAKRRRSCSWLPPSTQQRLIQCHRPALQPLSPPEHCDAVPAVHL